MKKTHDKNTIIKYIHAMEIETYVNMQVIRDEVLFSLKLCAVLQIKMRDIAQLDRNR